MTTKARHCDECEWFARNEIEHVCRKQHNPMFYKPKWVAAHFKDGGWKRKCEDFEDASRESTRHP